MTDTIPPGLRTDAFKLLYGYRVPEGATAAYAELERTLTATQEALGKLTALVDSLGDAAKQK